ncbi:DUF2333 family protein [Halioxenophilus sp. WMMB6]|uniref:DUF2333 family protein n=1 Tax=Halioxenophilus sp. WMMB6 TaxID=3073815 RepID=UPI00295F1E0A|nr:DUF2333 family protein [Halioxenophilus sp. WMMB6]
MVLNAVTRPWIRLRGWFRRWREEREDSRLWWWLLWFLLIYLLVSAVVGMFWSVAPDQFDVVAQTQARTGASSDARPVTGSVTTATTIQLVETLLNKRGGYLTNDITPPGLWLDNQPNWEYGVLVQVRDMSKALRESFSRSQTQSTEDEDLAKAEARFNFDNNNWMLPSTESQYQEGIEFLEAYLDRLVDEDQTNAQFYARADNLRYWLATVETRLGSLSQKLTASVGQRRINTDLAGESDATQSTAAPKEILVKTPWSEIDDVFFETRGSAWALLHLLRAVEQDFGAVLDKKNARVSLQQIIRELEATQDFIYSPMILNGDGFGFVANHSLVMASYISRANAALIDLRTLLEQG